MHLVGRTRKSVVTAGMCAALLASGAGTATSTAQDNGRWAAGPFGPPKLGLDVRDPGATEPGAGVRVEAVEPGSPAETAGFKRGDVIESLSGERIRSTRQFVRLVWELLPGRAIQATVRRDGAATELSITPGERTGPGISVRAKERLDALSSRLANLEDPWDSPRRGRFAGVGLSMIELTPQLARHFGVNDGVLISTVLEDSPSARAGFRAGDVITAIDSRAVHSRAEAVREISSAARNASVAVEIARDKKRSTLKLNPAVPNSR